MSNIRYIIPALCAVLGVGEAPMQDQHEIPGGSLVRAPSGSLLEERGPRRPAETFTTRATSQVAEAPWGPVAEWAVALRFDNPRAAVLVMVLG